MPDTRSSSLSPSSVNLARSSHPWTQADSAAGFVLRYLGPMRRQLLEILHDESLVEEALKRIIAHLVTAGFGKDKQGKLRDFLLRGVRSSAKAAVADLPEGKRPELDLTNVTLESERWLGYWREGLLERAWRSLERHEHASPDEPLYTVLKVVTEKPNEPKSKWLERIGNSWGRPIDEPTLAHLLPVARTQFAQLIADEVAETLSEPTRDEIKLEIKRLGLGRAFQGIQL